MATTVGLCVIEVADVLVGVIYRLLVLVYTGSPSEIAVAAIRAS
jgi:hypothetical protein